MPSPRDRLGRALPPGSPDELAHAEVPEEVVGSAAEACRRAIALFDQRRFFEAHEFFEYAWNSEDTDERDRGFWKGVTQVAVGCCHVQRGNVGGAVSLLERAASYLRDYPSPHLGIDTAALIDLACAVTERVRQGGASPDLDFPRFPTRHVS